MPSRFQGFKRFFVRLAIVFGIIVLSFSVIGPKATYAAEPKLLTGLPIVSLTFDDGDQSIYSNGFPILSAQQIPATLYMITGGLTSAWNTQLKDLENHGWEIGSHSVNHPHFTEITATQQISELSQSKASLIAAGVSVSGFAYPYGSGSSDTTIQSRVAQYYSYGRSVTEGYNDPGNLQLYRLYAMVQDSTDSIETMQGWVDGAIAANQWLIICMHTVDTTGNPYSISPTTLTALASYIKSKVDAGQIQASTVRDGLAQYGVALPGPVISNVSAVPGNHQASITWTTTNMPSSTIVDYGFTKSYGNTTAETNTSPRVTNHSVILTGLENCKTYHYRVRSRDASANEGNAGDRIFTTPYCDSIPPEFRNVSAVPTVSQILVNWTTNEAASSLVEYGLTTSYGYTTSWTDTSTLVINHSVTLPSTTACTTYHFRLHSTDDQHNEGISGDYEVTTACHKVFLGSLLR